MEIFLMSVGLATLFGIATGVIVGVAYCIKEEIKSYKSIKRENEHMLCLQLDGRIIHIDKEYYAQNKKEIDKFGWKPRG